MDIFDELYPGVKKFKVQDGIFFGMGTSREAFGAPKYVARKLECLKTKSFSGKWDQKLP